MQSGVLIKYKTHPDSPGFWYPCERAEVRSVVAGHHDHWHRRQVRRDGAEVVEEIPLADLAVTYCDGERDGKLVNPEVIDAAKLFGN